MGAATFTYQHTGSQPLNEAFSLAHSADGYEHGHSYSGSLGSKGSVTLIQRTPMAPSDALKLADQLIDADDPRISDKWGPAGAIPLTNEPAPVSTRTERVTVTLTSKTSDLSRSYAIDEAVRKAAADKVRLRKGEKVVEVVTKQDYQGKDLPEMVIETRVKAASMPGKALTRYVVADQSHGGREAVSWQDGFATLAEARAEVTKRAARTKPGALTNDVTYGIHAVTRRESDTPLVTVTRETVKVTAHVDVTVGAFAPVEEKVHTGWLFFGWASS